MYENVWIALLTLRTQEKSEYFDEFKEAFTTIFVRAINNKEAILKINTFSEENMFFVKEIENLELFTSRLNENDMTDEFKDIAERVCSSSMPVFTTFHIHEEDD